MLDAWRKDNEGATAMIVAVLLPIMILLGGIAIDQSYIQSQMSKLQVIADDGALYAVREMEIVRTDTSRIEQVALAYVDSFQDMPELRAQVRVDMANRTVNLIVSKEPETYFMNPLGMISTIKAESTAQLVGEVGNTCLIALDSDMARSLALNRKSSLTARDCALYSNSTSPQSLRVFPNASIVVSNVFLVGGYQGTIRGLSNEPVTDAPPIADPLAGRAPPAYGNCDFFDYIAKHDDTLAAGVYCGGLQISGARVNLEPGTYIIKDGPLTVNEGGWIEGRDVGFYLTGKDAKLNFEQDSHISLEAPRAGPLTGLLFFADITNPKTVSFDGGGAQRLRDGHVIRSDDARRLVGTIYLPDDKLVVDGETPVADQSEYTVIIAQSFELNNGPNLVIQSDYAASPVPVPEGVGPNNSTSAVLIR
jgi:hypothetical protein